MPPPQAKTNEIATSYSVTTSAAPYSAASLKSAVTVADSDGRNSSGIRRLRGNSSQSATRTITISHRSRLALIAASCRFADVTPDALAQPAECIAAQHFVGARARKLHLQMIDDPARPRRHHRDLVAEIDGLGQAVGDEHDGFSGRGPDPQQLVTHGHPRLLVERGERFVHQKHRRVLHQPARDRDALLHAAGEFVRMAFAETFEANEFQRVF